MLTRVAAQERRRANGEPRRRAGYCVLEMGRAFATVSGRAVPYCIVERRPGDFAQFYANLALAREALGWQTQLDIDAMCADTWRWQRWARENLKGGES